MTATEERGPGWKGFRTFIVERREQESETVTSFYLVPEDGKPLAPYKPGQFLGCKLDVPGEAVPVMRTYTISDCAGEGKYYRLSIKREPPPPDQSDAPPGKSSNYFHDHVHPGSGLQVRAPAGDFHLDEDSGRPVVLLSGGVGMTPMISMLNHIARNGAERPVWFIHGVRDGAEHAFGPHVRGLAETHANVHAHIVYLEPRPEDSDGGDYDGAGMIAIPLLEGLLPGPECDFYLCGPPQFMKALFNGLLDWGVIEDRIRYEFFGPATVLKEGPTDQPAAAVGLEVTFRASGVTVPWDPDKTSILDLAEASGLIPDFSCRSGVCHTCMCELVSGEIEYINDDVFLPDEEGQVLICSSRPKTDITLDI